MKLIGIMPVRNEDWVLGLTLRAALQWCDSVVVLDHASTDETSMILAEVSDEQEYDIGKSRVVRCRVETSTWEEMAHRQMLLDVARRLSATHVAIIDADEILTGNLLTSIRTRIERLQDGQVLQLPWVCMARGIDRYYTSGTWGDNFVSMAFHDLPSYGWAARGAEKYDFHHRHPIGSTQRHVVKQLDASQGGLMHLQFVSERQLRAKQALYKITEVLRWPGKRTVEELNAMYGKAVHESDPSRYATAQAPADWWAPYQQWMEHLHIDAEPWQEKAVRDAVAEHGAARFAGLDLFGVA